MSLDQWAEDHSKRALFDQTLGRIRHLWKESGIGNTRLMSGPYYAVIGVDLGVGVDKGTKPNFILPGEVQQKQQQEQKDGSEGTAEVHDAQPGECAR